MKAIRLLTARNLRRWGLAMLLAAAPNVWAANSPSQVFYVPFPEADAFAALTAVQPGDPPNNIPIPVNPMFTAISIAASADGTVIYYDQWEDGYEHGHDYAAPQQATTLIWGDGNIANGSPPGIPSDLINAGTVILLTNNVTTTLPLTIDYDARDKIASTRTISVTRTYWATGSSTLFAGCVETFDTGMWGTEYRAPIGQSIADATDGQMFEYAALSISASRDNTTVQVDADNNGAFETSVVLNEGQTHFVTGVNVGGRVLADKPVQVILFSGDVGSNYESRDSSLLPVSRWSNSYYTPVSTPSASGTRVWLYNPGASAITVTNSSRVGTGGLSGGSVSVGAGAVAAVTLVENAAYRFFTANGSPFYAYSTTDSTDTTGNSNQAFDWSFTLIPQQLLSPQVIVGLGIGRDPTSATLPNENGNPIWVTPVGNGSTPVVVYVDYDGDNTGPYQDAFNNRYDYSTNLVELQQAKLYDPDGDQTAMLVYVLSTNVSLAVAWGQDPLRASTGVPGLDVGTSIPPVEVFDTAKRLEVTGDTDGDGQLGPSERARYTIRVGNAARAPIPADFIVTDIVPVDTTYVSGSTYYRTSTNGSWLAVTDNGSGTAFPLDGAGFRIQAELPVKGAFEVRFDVDVDSSANLTAGAVSIVNTGTVHAVVYNRTLTFRNETELHGSLGDRVWSDANGNGQQDSGEVGISGVIIYLDVNTNGVRDAGEPYDTTAGDGGYLLTGTFIEAGTHQVRVDTATLPAGAVRTWDLDGTNTAHVATVALAAGQDRTDVDFGYRVPARLGDFVWVDSNGNGQQDAGEPGLSNVAVRLYTNSTVVVAVTTSSVAGAYVFTNLFAGTYTVGFTPPSGYLFTASKVGNDAGDSDPLTGTNRTAAVTLVSGQTNLTVDAGFYQPVAIGDFVWADANGNGQQDGGEAGIGGVTVTLLRPGYGPDGIPGNADDASSVATTASGAGGSYSFTNLPPGTYQVGFGAASGYYRTAADQGSDTTDSDANVGTGLTTAFAVISGQTIATIDAGYQAVTVGDFIWTDADADGVQDAGEPGIAGVQVQVYTAAGSPYQTRTALGAFADNFDPTGGYAGSDGTLAWAADWTAANSATVVQNTGTDYEIRIADAANSTLTRSFTAPTNTARLTISFDYRAPASGNDTVAAQWSSNNVDWVTLASYDTGSNVSGTTNFTVTTTAGTRYIRFSKTAAPNNNPSTEYLYFDNVSILAESALTSVTATTDTYGYYRFGPSAGLLSGTNYQVRVATNQTALAGLALTGQNQGGSDATDSDATLATAVGFATIAFAAPAAGGSDQTLDFGFKGTASFGDRVWTDLDGDGTLDTFESGIAGVRVYVDSNGSGTYNVGEPTAVTAANGSYLIGELVAGTYAARVDASTLPAGLTQTYDLNGALDHAASVTLAAGQTRTDVDFGYRSTAVYVIRGQVRDDYDLDGALSDPDQPVGGVLVSLYSDPNGDGTNTDGTVIGTVRTTPDGRYAFTNVMSGAYVVVESDPTYSVSTADTVAANDNRIPVVIIAADSNENNFLDAVDPSGYIYDVADGRIVPGGLISVSGPGAYVLMDGSSGQYMFIATNAPGTYTIALTVPPGYILDPTRPAQPGSFDPTGGANPTVLGSYENAANPGYLVNTSAASNTYYYTFALAPGDPPVINNNFPLVKVVIEIAGTVFNDQNRLTDGIVNGTGTNAAGLFANLVNPATHAVIAGVAVASNGVYRFADTDGVVTNTAYEVILTRTSQTVGATLTSATLPTGWVSTGEHVGAGAGSDGTVDSRLLVSTTADGVREVNFGIIKVPDITPVITAVPNVMHAVQRFYITVRSTELNLVDTFGLITIRIPKDIRWVFDGPYDPTLTMLGSTTLNNSVWAYSEDSTHHIFTSTAVIPTGGYSYFGFRAIWNAGQTRGRYTITSQIDSWSGGEDRIDNNVDAERLDYFIN